MARGYFALAGQVAFFFLLSIFPGLLLISAALTFLPDCRQHYSDIRGLLSAFLPDSASRLLQEAIRESHICSDSAPGVLSVSALILAWAGSNGFASMMRAMNRAYGIEENRPFWQRRLLAIGFLLGAIAAVAAIFPALFFGGSIGERIARAFDFEPVFLVAWRASFIPAAILLGVGGLALLYKFGPAWKVRTRAALLGAATSATGIALISWLFKQFTALFSRYESVYGAISAVIVLMVWQYFVAVMMLIGGLVVITHHSQRA